MPAPSPGQRPGNRRAGLVFLAVVAVLVIVVARRVGGPRRHDVAPPAGKPAPEIEGEDLDGHPFKLSDYRGKVVLLDFWGDW